jgi:hypothetical protein
MTGTTRVGMPLFLPAELTFTCYITYIAFSSDMSFCRIISSFFLPFMINRLRLRCVSCLRNEMKSQGKNTEIYQRQKACAEPKCKHFSYLFSSQSILAARGAPNQKDCLTVQSGSMEGLWACTRSLRWMIGGSMEGEYSTSSLLVLLPRT